MSKEIAGRSIDAEKIMDLSTIIISALEYVDDKYFPDELSDMELMLAFFVAGEQITGIEMPTGDLLGELYISYNLFLNGLHEGDEDDEENVEDEEKADDPMYTGFKDVNGNELKINDGVIYKNIVYKVVRQPITRRIIIANNVDEWDLEFIHADCKLIIF